MGDIVDQVIAQLKTLDLDDEDVAAYIAGIIQEDSIPNEEKHEAIVEFLAATTEKDTSDAVDRILKDWERTQEEVAQAEARRKAEAIAEAKEREKARQQKLMEEKVQREQAAAEQEARRQKTMSKEDRAVRDRVMQQYSYDNLDQKEPSLGEGNRNADVVKEQEQRRREQMKKQSEAEKERNKMLLEKQRQKDEKDKKRTVKKEKRRM